MFLIATQKLIFVLCGMHRAENQTYDSVDCIITRSLLNITPTLYHGQPARTPST